MGLMEIRRRMLTANKNKLPDTTAQIAEYGYSWGRGKYAKDANANYGISVFYNYSLSSSNRTLVTMCLNPSTMLMLQKDGVYKDWWGQTTIPAGGTWQTTEGERKVINANTNEVSCSIYLPLINNTYAYIKESGEILFAGKHTPYYGYTNISDMPT